MTPVQFRYFSKRAVEILNLDGPPRIQARGNQTARGLTDLRGPWATKLWPHINIQGSYDINISNVNMKCTITILGDSADKRSDDYEIGLRNGKIPYCRDGNIFHIPK